jgi:hypothetical protein
MTSEWMKVMLEEIARKKAEAEQAQAEEQQREESEQREGSEQSVHTAVVLQSSECARREIP